MKSGVVGFLQVAVMTTVLVLATIFVLNRFTLTRGIVQAAITG
jgi:hypothetical protein